MELEMVKMGDNTKRKCKTNRQFNINNKGFSLVEVLVAMAVLAIIAIPVLNAFSNSARVNARARREENANTAASDVVEKFKAMNEDKLNELKNLTIGSTSSEGYKLLDIDSDGKYTFDISNNIKNGTDYYKGIDDEEFYVTAVIDPGAYKDGSKDNNDKNNINSYTMPQYSSLSPTKNFVLRDELYKCDSAAESNFSYLAGASYSKSKIVKSTTINVNVEQIAGSDSDFTQTVTASVVYSYNDKADGTSSYEPYKEEVTMPVYAFKAAYDGSSKYTVSSELDNNLKKVYIFYTPFDDYSTANVSGESNMYYSSDKINIYYNYKNIANVNYENCNVYLVSQEKVSAANKNIKMQLKNTQANPNIEVYINNSKKTLWTEGTLNLSDIVVTSGIPTGPVNIYSNVYDWNKCKVLGDTRGNSLTSNNSQTADDKLYTLTVTVWYKDKTKSNSDAIMANVVTTKSNW